ncbi:MAG: sulfotransferase family protein [Pseudomonadota bacterium]
MAGSQLQILGAGMGRTGTDSLRNGLIQLGFDPCHHMFVLREDARHVPPWLAVARGEAAPDWDGLLEGFQAQLDWPGAFYWRELSQHFPEAKVILTLRDAQSWYKSLASTILPFIAAKGRHLPPHRNQIAEISEIILDRTFEGRVLEPEHAMAVFDAHTQEVIAAIPPERLLVYPVGSGWEPLCQFLDCPVPDTSFPSGNSTKDFQDRVAANLRPE